MGCVLIDVAAWRHDTERKASMNIAFFIMPKSNVACLYDDFTVRQGLEKLKYHGYTAIPVITRGNQYVGTVSEGDFLWLLYGEHNIENGKTPMEKLENTKIRDVMKLDKNPPVHITANMEQMLDRAMNQNFVPVIDDVGSFVGIITRRDIIRYYASGKDGKNKN